MVAKIMMGNDVVQAPSGLSRFDAPKTPGPWALNKNGVWFKVTKQAPGSRVDGNIYLPPLHPSVRKTIPEFNNAIPAEDRFTSAKMRAANQATLRGAWRDLFFRIAPRGSGPQGIGAGMAFDGEDDDYNSEGGELYPDLDPSDPIANELTQFWNRGYDPIYGSGRLDLSWLRVYTDSDGYQRYKGFAKPEVAEFMNRWMIAKNNFVCGGDEVINLTNQTMAGQAARQAAQPEKDYTPHWAWHITPINQCMPKSSRRRRKAIKKAAIVAAVVVGAVFLGPMIVGAIKSIGAGGAAASGGGKAAIIGAKAAKSASIAAKVAKGASIAAKVGGAASVASAASDASGASGIMNAAQNIAPKVVKGINQARTVQAIVNGEVPPPPIDIRDGNFTDWATAVGEQYIAGEMNDAEREIMNQEVRRIQNQATRTLPPNAQYMPSQSVPYPVQNAMGQQKDSNELMQTALMIGIPLVAFLAFKG